MPPLAAAPTRELEAATGTPVIWTEVRYIRGGANGGVFFPKATPLKVLEWGNPMGDLVEEMDRRPDEVMVTKQYPSAFFGTSLVATLNGLRADTLIITGCTTSGCIRATAVDAVQHGFRPICVRECVGDRHEGPHEANLFDINAKYGDVISKAEALEYIRSL